MELPLLRLGLLGFNAQDSQLAVAQIASAVPMASRWEVVAFEDADIWLLNSRCVTAVANRGLRIQHGADEASSLMIYPQQATRPMAFTLPVTEGVNAVLSVQLDNPRDCARGLDSFALAMPRVCNHFALGEQVASRQSNLHDSTYHLSFEGRLIAVVDFAAWRVSIASEAKPIELALASWRHRPADMSIAPASFETSALERLMWVYASRTRKPTVPQAYQSSTIYLRRLSTLPQSWLHHDHMNLISYLNKQPRTLAQLQQVTQLSSERLLACVSALYYSGTITVNPAQVQRNASALAQGARLEEQDASAPDSTSSIFDSQPVPLTAK